MVPCWTIITEIIVTSMYPICGPLVFWASPSCLIRVDIVPNFFMARTGSVRKVYWDERLKYGEHQDFFLRARWKKLAVGACETVTIKYKQVVKAEDYYQRRAREQKYLVKVIEKHNIARLVTSSGLTYAKTDRFNMNRPSAIDDSWK